MKVHAKKHASIKGRSHGHCNAHPISFQRSHESELDSDVHQMRIAFNPPREVVWKRIETGLHYYS